MKKNKGGRPLKFTLEELERKIDEYFESCFEEVWYQVEKETEKGPVTEWVPQRDKDGNVVKRQVKPYTVTGLAVYLNTTRELLNNYEDLPEFRDTIKRAKQKIENYAEERLFDAKNPTGIIFNLKNNWGWRDKHDIEHSGGVHHTQQLDKLTDDQLAQLESILNQNKDA